MLSAEAVVRVVDGSGVLRARVLRVLKGRGPGSTAAVGDRVRVAVVEARPGSAWRRGDLARGLVLRTRAPRRTRAGLRLRFDTAISRTGHWQHSRQVAAHPATAGVGRRRNRFGPAAHPPPKQPGSRPDRTPNARKTPNPLPPRHSRAHAPEGPKAKPRPPGSRPAARLPPPDRG